MSIEHKQKTILISINTSWNIVNFRSGLIRALKAAGYRIITAAPKDNYTAKLRTIVDEHFDLPMQNAGTSPLQEMRLLLRYITLLRETRPDIILTYTIKPNIYGALAARLLGIPILNNVSGLGTAFIRHNWLTTVVKLLYRFAFKRSACVFFQNSEDRDLFLDMKLVREEQTALLAGSGVDLEYFTPHPKTQSDAITFVLIARMLWDKGIGEYVEAARKVKAIYPHITFRLVGAKGVQNKTAIPDIIMDGWLKEAAVEYLGERDDIRNVIVEHDCVVLPSYREGMSRTLLEAAAMGKPLIATNVTGCKQIIDNHKNGLLCEPRNAEDLAAKLMEFIKLSPEERMQMGNASRLKAEKEFDEKYVFEAYLQKIATILSGQKRDRHLL